MLHITYYILSYITYGRKGAAKQSRTSLVSITAGGCTGGPARFPGTPVRRAVRRPQWTAGIGCLCLARLRRGPAWHVPRESGVP